MFKSELSFLQVEELMCNFGESHCRAKQGEGGWREGAVFAFFLGLWIGLWSLLF
jgi:hypothetical protein